jgi:hypothetical protein
MKASLLTFLFLFSYTILPAQWYGNGTQASEACIELQGLLHIPELHTDMPLDCLIGYIAMDSIARTGRIIEATTAPQNALLSELRGISRYVYAMADYDPILLKRHFLSTMDSAYPNGKYQSYPANTYYSVMREVYDRRQTFGTDYAMLIMADYVLHIRVIDVRSGIDSTMFPPGRNEQTNVACEVVEIFKGRHLPNNCSPAFHNTQGTEKYESPLSPPPCFIYGHHTRYEQYIPKRGDEMVILLNIATKKDKICLIYPLIGVEKTGGRFFIRNGQVEDPDNIWGLGGTPSFESFRSNLLQKITTIRSWSE